ncbi:ABC transporter permease, partial [Burkholderia sp. Tr-860]|nr:ABC transporter permease [Burkholderia sp. Tr-860]
MSSVLPARREEDALPAAQGGGVAPRAGAASR